MKKITLAILFINIVIFSGIALSQQNQKDRTGWQNKTPEEIAAKKTDRMKEKLSLTESQYKQVYNLMLSKVQDRKNNKEKYKSMDESARKELKKQSRDQFHLQLQGILSKEQLDKLSQMKGKYKDGKKNKDRKKTKD